MATKLTDLRPASPVDAQALADVQDDSWRLAYRGMLPGLALERMLAHRRAAWWHQRLSDVGPDHVWLLTIAGASSGYVSFGARRPSATRLRLRGEDWGEIYELYLCGAAQGLGFGRLMFGHACDRLARRGFSRAIVWALTDNHDACRFYYRMGGQVLGHGLTRFGAVRVDRTAFAFETHLV